MRIYFMGICGTAMGHAALLLRQLGHQVLGSDQGIYPPMSDLLARSGIELHDGYDPDRLARLAPDLVVIGNAQSRGHPEVEWLWETRRFRHTSLPALLHDHVLRERRNLVISGTHGKTTTTSLAAFLLRAAGRDPGFLIGGVPRDLPVGAWPGDPHDPFVIEGDEYDSAFFDKRSKFIHYAPHLLVCNNLEFDHADIFRDLADVQRTFRHALRLVPRHGAILLNGDDPNLLSLLPAPWTRVWRVGLDPACDLRLGDFTESAAGSSFTLHWRGRPWAEVRWSLPGLFNARNAAMAALAAGLSLHPDDPTRLDLAPLARFEGVRRRQEVLARSDRVVAMEDFGHHPTALAATLQSLRARFPGHRLVACFEPRSNTATKSVFQREFAEALAGADLALLGPVHRAEKIPAAERLDLAAIVRHLRDAGREGVACPDNRAVLEELLRRTLRDPSAAPHLVCFFSNGSFDGIIAEFAAAVRLSA